MDSATRRLGVLDLPNELLVMIFKELKYSCWDPDETKTRSYTGRAIGNARLTCQRFCSTSSHLLLDSVSVEMNFRSLKRFFDISQHPLIAIGVRVVRVLLHYYSHSIAEDLAAYGRYNAAKIGRPINYLEYMMTGENGRRIRITERMHEEYRQGKKMMESWRRLGQDEEEGPFRRMGLSGYDTYCSRYQEQESLRENQIFSQCVAAVMARMPAVRELDFYDSPGYHSNPRTRDVLNHDQMMEMLISPSSWADADEDGLAAPFCEIVFDLPLALRNVGVQLTSLRIGVSLLRAWMHGPSTEEATGLTAAMQNLKKFEYVSENGRTRHGEGSWERRHLKYLPISRYTRAILDTSSIEEIHLNYVPKPLVCLLEFMIPHRDRSNLKKVHLAGGYIHPGCLQRFLNSCDRAVLKHLDLWYMKLLSGTWAETLAILRGSCSGHVSIHWPMGAECDELESDGDRFDWIFKVDEDSDNLSRAARYVLGLIASNPILEVV